MIPENAIISRNNQYFVDKKTPSGTQEVQVTLGLQDAANAQVLSGVVAGDEVATH